MPIWPRKKSIDSTVVPSVVSLAYFHVVTAYLYLSPAIAPKWEVPT
jgi:hypothetical protein